MPAETRAGDDAMKVPTHDAAPGAKSYGGMGERVLRAMGWSKCARPTTEATDATDDRRRDARPRREERRLTARERPRARDRGDGLGKRRHGRAEAIEVVKREDNAGVGKRKTRYAWDEKWWEGTYANAASKIARVVGGEEDGKTTSSTLTSGRDGDSSESEDSSEDEVAARLGTATGRDGVAFSGSKSDLQLMRELAEDNHRGSTFGGRVGKLERIAKFEAEQLAKYGIQRGSASAPAAAETKKKPKEKSKKDKKKRKSDGEGAVETTVRPSGVSYEGEKSLSTKLSDWWTRAGFAWGGLVGSKRERDLNDDGAADDEDGADRAKRGKGFTENDQEALFKSAHETNVAKGTKRGLGGRGVLKSEWTGVRRTDFGDDDDDDVAKNDARRKNEKAKKEKKEKKDKKEKKQKKEKKEKSRTVEVAR